MCTLPDVLPDWEREFCDLVTDKWQSIGAYLQICDFIMPVFILAGRSINNYRNRCGLSHRLVPLEWYENCGMNSVEQTYSRPFLLHCSISADRSGIALSVQIYSCDHCTRAGWQFPSHKILPRRLDSCEAGTLSTISSGGALHLRHQAVHCCCSALWLGLLGSESCGLAGVGGATYKHVSHLQDKCIC